MTYAITLVALVAAGVALLDLLRLRTGHVAPDLALGWLVGGGWLAAIAPLVRFALRVPLGRAALALVLLGPIVAAAAVRARRRAREKQAPAASPAPAAPLPAEGALPGGGRAWLPRPAWLFAPVAAYVVVVAAAVVLHGSNMPTQTDDGVRIRAFAPILAFQDDWSPATLAVFAQAAPLTTFVPAVGWIATGSVDHFHVNYAVLTELLALLVLAVGLGTARGRPEQGWAGAFALLTIPLLVYHCTSTYSDAVLALRVAGGVLLAVEYARTKDRADLSRALLLVGIAALVKREGELVAAAPGGVLLAQIAWERWRERRPVPWGAVALLVAPGLLAAIGKIAALGLAGAFPMVGFVVSQAGVAVGAAGAGGRASGIESSAAAVFLDGALFRSGNAGMLYWIFLAVLTVRARAILRGELAWPLLCVAALLAEVAVNSIWIVPQFTLDQGTVNRALLVASAPAALWAAAAIVDAARAEALANGAAPVSQEQGREEAAVTPRRRGRRTRR